MSKVQFAEATWSEVLRATDNTGLIRNTSADPVELIFSETQPPDGALAPIHDVFELAPTERIGVWRDRSASFSLWGRATVAGMSEVEAIRSIGLPAPGSFPILSAEADGFLHPPAAIGTVPDQTDGL